MEADEYEITRGTCFVARRLELVTVAGLLWISLCVLDAVDLFVFFFPFFFPRAHPACYNYEAALLIYLSTSNTPADDVRCLYLFQIY